MGALDWLGRSVSYARTDGVRAGMRRSADEFKTGVARRLDPYVPGDPVFARDWDLLVVLDACRPDALAEVADGYAFLPAEPGSIRSVAGCSKVWMERTFTPEWRGELQETAYVTANPYSDEYVDPEAFALVDEVWRDRWDDDLGTVRARAVTDRAIAAARTHEHDRLLVHYMQPHFPSVPDPLDSGIDIDNFGEWDSVWDRLRAGDASVERVWRSYRANLEYVLDDVALLLENCDADTAVLTADHGNAFGEWGFYGHPPRTPIPAIRRVPWVETSARDRGTHTPAAQPDRVDESAGSVESHLRELGYLGGK
jgi:hypothetical protein